MNLACRLPIGMLQILKWHNENRRISEKRLIEHENFRHRMTAYCYCSCCSSFPHALCNWMSGFGTDSREAFSSSWTLFCRRWRSFFLPLPRSSLRATSQAHSLQNATDQITILNFVNLMTLVTYRATQYLAQHIIIQFSIWNYFGLNKKIGRSTNQN